MGKLSLLFLLLISVDVSAQVRVFLSSDNHSNYERAILYMKTTEALQEQMPQSLSIHIFNGDISGAQKSTYFDQGWTLYKMMALLGQTTNIVINVGNHEGHDFSNRGDVPEAEKNKLFIEQNQFLMSAIPNFRLTTANFDIKSEYQNMFQPYQDFKAPSGKVLRIVGLGLESYFLEASYSPSSQYNWLLGIRPGEEEFKKQLIIASQENVNAVIVMVHDGFKYIREVIEHINAWKNDPAVLEQYPHLKNIKIPVALGGHEHSYHREKIGETEVIESGFNFDFSMLDLDEDLNLKDLKLYGQEDQEAFASKTLDDPRLQEAQQLLREEIKKNEAQFAKVLAPTRDHTQGLTDLFKKPTYLGINIANSFQQWAQEVLGIARPEEVIAFINPTSYRPKNLIPEGSFTFGQLLDFVPYSGQTSIYETKGAVIQKIYTALRTSSEGKPYASYLPFIPSNFQEGENKILLDHNGQPLDPNKKYILILDQWLSINGHKIGGMNDLIAQMEKLNITGNREQQDIIKKYMVPKLNSQSIQPTEMPLCSGFFQ